MREIKFRAWDKKKKKWTLPLVCYCGNKVIIELFNYEKDARGELIDVEVMQYTGLKDKNCREIYEEDILRWHGMVGIITWEDAGFELQVKYKNGTYSHYSLADDATFDDMEIIGNIYENPELMENA